MTGQPQAEQQPESASRNPADNELAPAQAVQTPGADIPPHTQTATAIRAVRWTLLGSILQRAITFGSVAVIARLITETEYGAYRQLLSVHMIIFVLLPLGFDQLYIREIKQRELFARLVAGALAVCATLAAVVMLAGHWMISDWMDFALWDGMLWAFPAVTALQAWKLFYKTDLAAKLDYRRIGMGEALYSAVMAVISISLVLVWPQAWCLYVGYAVAEIVELWWLKHGNIIKLPPLVSAVREFRQQGGRWKRFGVYHCGTQVLNAVGGNAPVIIFGSALSKASAAAFSMANYLVTVPIFILISALHRVAYSALAGRSREQLTGAVLQMLSMSAAFIVPVLIWVAALAEPLVHIALGADWVDSTAPVARIIAIFCIFVALFSPISSIDLLLDRPDYGFYWNVVATVVRVIAILVGLKSGVLPAVMAYAAVSVVLWLIWGGMLAHLLGAGQWRFHARWLRLVPLWIMLWLLIPLFNASVEMAGITLREYPLAEIAASTMPLVVYGGVLWISMPDIAALGIRILKR